MQISKRDQANLDSYLSREGLSAVHSGPLYQSGGAWALTSTNTVVIAAGSGAVVEVTRDEIRYIFREVA